MHRIGRTGRGKEKGKSLLFYTPKEEAKKEAIETLMKYEMPLNDFPEEVTVSAVLTDDERPQKREKYGNHKIVKSMEAGDSFHEKKEKNKVTNQGGSYKKEIAGKYKKLQHKRGKRK